MDQELTTSNKILVVALKLADERETFTAEDLIVHSWKEFPDSFGLSGYRDLYPDSNRVLSKLMGSVGLTSRGWLEQVSTKTYRMTPAGRKFATQLRSGNVERERRTPAAPRAPRPAAPVAATPVSAAPPPPASTPTVPPIAQPASSVQPPPPVVAARKPAAPTSAVATAPLGPTRTPAPAAPARTTVPTPAVRPAAAAPPAPRPAPEAATSGNASGPPFEGATSLSRLSSSVANQKFGRGAMVTFQDACAFWGITPSITAKLLAARLEEIQSLLKRAEGFIASHNAPIRLDGRTDVTLTTVIGLQGLHRMLSQRYQRELDGIRHRSSSSSHDDD